MAKTTAKTMAKNTAKAQPVKVAEKTSSERIEHALRHVVNDSLSIEDVATVANNALIDLEIDDPANGGVDALDATTIKYYRRSAVGILSAPRTNLGGYGRRHILEALAARLGGATMETTLAGSAKALEAARREGEKAILEYTARLAQQARWNKQAASGRLATPHAWHEEARTVTARRVDEIRGFAQRALDRTGDLEAEDDLMEDALNRAQEAIKDGGTNYATWQLPGGGMLMLPAEGRKGEEEKEEILRIVAKAVGK